MKVEFKILGQHSNFQQSNLSKSYFDKTRQNSVLPNNMLNALNSRGLLNKNLINNSISFTSLVKKSNFDLLDPKDLKEAYEEFGARLLDSDYPKKFATTGRACLSPRFIADKDKLYQRIDIAKKILLPYRKTRDLDFNSQYFAPDLFRIAFEDDSGKSDEVRQNLAIMLKESHYRLDPFNLRLIADNLVKDGEFNQDLADYVTYICENGNKNNRYDNVFKHLEWCGRDEKENYEKVGVLTQMYKVAHRDFQDIYSDTLSEYLEKIGVSATEFAGIFKDYNENNLSDDELDILADLSLSAKAGKFNGKFLKEFSDLDLDNRLDVENKINNEGVKADLMKSKYSTYYRVKNKKDELFVTFETNVRVNQNGGHYPSGESNYGNYKYHNPYHSLKIKFPKGTWKPTTGIKFVDVAETMGAYMPTCSQETAYVRETYKVANDYDEIEISLDNTQTEYFEKMSDDELQIE